MKDKLLLTKLYYKNVLSYDFKNKEELLNSFKNEIIHRIRNNFNLSVIGYYDLKKN